MCSSDLEYTGKEGVWVQMATGAARVGFLSEAFAEKTGNVFTRIRPDQAPPGYVLCLETDAIEEAVARARKAGAQVLQDAHEIPSGQRVANLRDINGCIIQLTTPWKKA